MTAAKRKMSAHTTDPECWNAVSYWTEKALDTLADMVGIRVLKWNEELPHQADEVEITDETKFKKEYDDYVRKTTPALKGNL